MKYSMIIICVLFSSSGCVSSQEGYLHDREFGQATQATLASQIVPSNRQTNKTPEGVAGITAEEIMAVYNGTFADKPMPINVLELGSSSEN